MESINTVIIGFYVRELFLCSVLVWYDMSFLIYWASFSGYVCCIKSMCVICCMFVWQASCTWESRLSLPVYLWHKKKTLFSGLICCFVSFSRNKEFKRKCASFYFNKTFFDVLLSLVNVLQSWEYKHSFFSNILYRT